MTVIRALHHAATACVLKLGRFARNGSLGAAIVCLFVVSAPALGQEEAVSAETAYAALVETIQEINLLLEEALELAGRGVGERSLEEQLALSEELVHVIEGSGTEHKDPLTGKYVRVGDGLVPLWERYFTLAYRVDTPAVDVILQALPLETMLRAGDLMMFRADSFLRMALNAAGAVPSIEGDDLEAMEARSDAFRSAYAHLLVVRGAKSDPNLVAGFLVLADLLPPLEMTLGPGDSIQEAIDRIPSGGIIRLQPGTYHETLAIDKPLTLIGSGQGETILQGVEWRPGVIVMAQAPIDVTVRDLTFAGGAGGVMAGGEARVRLESLEFLQTGEAVSAMMSAQVTCEACQFKECVHALSVYNEAYLELREGCRISEAVSGSLAAVFVNNSASLVVSDCTIEDNATNAIFLQGDVNLHITDSVIQNNEGYGIGFCDPFPGLRQEDERNEPYDGTVTGGNNIIPGADEENPNLRGAVCPLSLNFLTEPLPED